MVAVLSYLTVLVSPVVPYAFLVGVILTLGTVRAGMLVLPLLPLVKELVVVSGSTVIKFFGASLAMTWIATGLLRRRLPFTFDLAVALMGAWAVTALGSWLYLMSDHMLLGRALSVGALNDIRDEVLGRVWLILFVLVLYQYLVGLGRSGLSLLLGDLARVATLGLIFTHLAVFAKYTGIEEWNGFYRVYLAFHDPNDYATITAALTAFPTLLLVEGRGPWKVLALACVLLSALAVFGTLSRTGIAAFFMVIGLSSFTYTRGTRWRAAAYGTVFAGILVLAGAVIGPQSLVARLYATSLTEPSFGQRLAMWKAAWSAFMERPLFGHGGTIISEFALSREVLGKELVVHSTYVGALFQYGLWGALLLVATLVTVVGRAFRLRAILTPREAAPTLVLSGMLVGGVALEWLFKELMWIALAMSLAISSVVYRERGSLQQ